MQTIKDSIKTIAVSLITLSLISIAYAWTEPISTPPADNASTPVNISKTGQIKDGGFWVGSDADAITAGGGAGLIVENGNVGIGTPDPKTKLDVDGPVRVGQYSTKPTCDANTTGSIVFDTANDKPYVCAASGVWKPLDSDGDKDGLIASFDDNDGSPKSASTAIAGAILSGYKAYGYSGGANGAWSQITGTYTPPASREGFWTGTKLAEYQATYCNTPTHPQLHSSSSRHWAYSQPDGNLKLIHDSNAIGSDDMCYGGGSYNNSFMSGTCNAIAWSITQTADGTIFTIPGYPLLQQQIKTYIAAEDGNSNLVFVGESILFNLDGTVLDKQTCKTSTWNWP